jgi:hypothetical protein
MFPVIKDLIGNFEAWKYWLENHRCNGSSIQTSKKTRVDDIGIAYRNVGFSCSECENFSLKQSL